MIDRRAYYQRIATGLNWSHGRGPFNSAPYSSHSLSQGVVLGALDGSMPPRDQQVSREICVRQTIEHTHRQSSSTLRRGAARLEADYGFRSAIIERSRSRGKRAANGRTRRTNGVREAIDREVLKNWLRRDRCATLSCRSRRKGSEISARVQSDTGDARVILANLFGARVLRRGERRLEIQKICIHMKIDMKTGECSRDNRKMMQI